MADRPIACTLDAATLAERKTALLPGLAQHAASRVALDNGVRMEFRWESGILETIGSIIAAEHQCCRFLHFQLTVGPGDGAVTLDVTGPDGTAEFLEQLMGAEG